MGIGGYVARELVKELDNRSREFYEFVMPAIDMEEEGNELVVKIDLPGFEKDNINLRVAGNVLSITAQREQDEKVGTVYFRHRPLRINKKVTLPFTIEGEEREEVKRIGQATYVNGVVTLRIPIPKSTNIAIT